MSWIQVYGGGEFCLEHPNPDSITPQIIATALSRMCRFGGHCSKFYSVAQHSLLVESLVDEPELKLPALLHDAHEGLWGLGDICNPAKRIMPVQVERWMKDHQERVDRAIATRFGVPRSLFHHPSVKRADLIALATERRDIMPGGPDWVLGVEPIERVVHPWMSRRAKVEFLARLSELIQ